MVDGFAGTRTFEGPASYAFAITTHDTTELAHVTRGIYVGGAGNVVAILEGQSAAVTFTAVPAGTLLPIRAKVVTTASTATSMVGVY